MVNWRWNVASHRWFYLTGRGRVSECGYLEEDQGCVPSPSPGPGAVWPGRLPGSRQVPSGHKLGEHGNPSNDQLTGWPGMGWVFVLFPHPGPTCSILPAALQSGSLPKTAGQRRFGLHRETRLVKASDKYSPPKSWQLRSR